MMTPDRSDIFFAAGSALITWGAWWIYPPAGPIVLGLFLVAVGYALEKVVKP